MDDGAIYVCDRLEWCRTKKARRLGAGARASTCCTALAAALHNAVLKEPKMATGSPIVRVDGLRVLADSALDLGKFVGRRNFARHRRTAAAIVGRRLHAMVRSTIS